MTISDLELRIENKVWGDIKGLLGVKQNSAFYVQRRAVEKNVGYNI